MLDIKVIREDPERVKKVILDRGMSAEVADIDGALELDAQRRDILVKVEEMKHERNQASETIVAMKKEGLRRGQRDSALSPGADNWEA